MPSVEPQSSSKNTPNPPKNRQIQAKSSKKPKNPDELRDCAAAANRKHYAANRERLSKRSQARYWELDPSERAMRQWRGAANPSTPKLGSLKAQDPRFMALVRAFCDFSDLEEVIRIYMSCAIMNELGLGKYHVDHSVPLSSYWVCGLHTHTNLQVISEEDNRRKGNILWPQMWPQDWSTMDLLM